MRQCSGMRGHLFVMRVDFARELIEESVRLAAARSEERFAFERDREDCYESEYDDTEAREARFAAVFDRWFGRLHIADPVHMALAERPRIAESVAGMRVETATRAGDQGVELFVAPPEAGAAEAERRWLVGRILPVTLVEVAAATALLRPELLHVCDMLDPDFEYEPELPPSPAGPTHDRLLLERYGALWAASVAYRLEREGQRSATRLQDARARLVGAFPMHADDLDVVFADLLAGRRLRHGELVRIATAPRGIDAGPVRGSRCSLCGFPTYAFADAVDVAGVGEKVRVDFPMWEANAATCPQCVDLYASRLPASP